MSQQQQQSYGVVQDDEDMTEELGSLSWLDEEMKKEDEMFMQDDEDMSEELGSMSWFDEIDVVSMSLKLSRREATPTHFFTNMFRTMWNGRRLAKQSILRSL
jgi:hypothetical protein